MSRRGIRIAAYTLGGAAAVVGGLLLAARALRAYTSHGSPFAPDNDYAAHATISPTILPPAERGERSPSSDEYALITLVRPKGWPVDDPNVRFGTDANGPYLLVRVESGDIRVERVKGTEEFRVVTFANGRPATSRMQDLNPEYLAITSEVHNRVNGV